jgi:hypothetical protein
MTDEIRRVDDEPVAEQAVVERAPAAERSAWLAVGAGLGYVATAVNLADRGPAVVAKVAEKAAELFSKADAGPVDAGPDDGGFLPDE